MCVIVQEQRAAAAGAPSAHDASPTQTTDPASSQQLADAVPRPKPSGGRGARSRGPNPYPTSGKGRGSSSKGRFPGPICSAPVDEVTVAPEVVDLATPPAAEREGSAPAALDRRGKPEFKIPLGRAARLQRGRLRMVPLRSCKIWKKQLPPQDSVPYVDELARAATLPPVARMLRAKTKGPISATPSPKPKKGPAPAALAPRPPRGASRAPGQVASSAAPAAGRGREATPRPSSRPADVGRAPDAATQSGSTQPVSAEGATQEDAGMTPVA